MRSVIVSLSGIVLLIASSLKFSVVCNGCPEFCIFGSCAANVTVAFLEGVLGILIIAARSFVLRWYIAVVMFFILFLVAFSLFLFGGKKCHCFGHLPVLPLHMLVCDGLILVALLWADNSKTKKPNFDIGDKKLIFSPSWSCFAVAVLFSGVILAKIGQYSITGDGYIEVGGFVILQPRSWKSDEYPKEVFSEFGLTIDDKEKLNVLFVRGNCEHCRLVLKNSNVWSNNGTVVVVLPPSGETTELVRSMGYEHRVYDGPKNILLDVPWLVRFSGRKIVSSNLVSDLYEE